MSDDDNGDKPSPKRADSSELDPSFSNKRRRPNEASTSSFLQSMTFASVSHIQCDCDECGGAMRQAPSIPNAIQQALANYKRQQGLKRTQQRRLIRQHAITIDNSNNTTMISIYEWTLPRQAEPLLEFGDSHRLVYVKQSAGAIKHIGTGIVGSRSEELSRTILDWKSHHAYWVPSRQGKAIGWIHGECNEQQNESTNSPQTTGHVVLYVIKVPPAALDSDYTLESSCSAWCGKVINLCRRLQQQHNDDEDGTQSHELDTADARMIEKVLFDDDDDK